MTESVPHFDNIPAILAFVQVEISTMTMKGQFRQDLPGQPDFKDELGVFLDRVA